MIRFILITIILFTFLFGFKTYAQKHDILEIPNTPVSIPYQTKEINFRDERTNKLPMGWKVPFTSFKPVEFTGNPELTSADSIAIKSIINNAQSETDKPAKITVVIREGVVKLYGDWKSAKESVKIQMDLEVEELDSNGFIRSSYEIANELNTFNAKEKSVIATYSKALKYAVYQCLFFLTKNNGK